jgi:hypothetical protein
MYEGDPAMRLFAVFVATFMVLIGSAALPAVAASEKPFVLEKFFLGDLVAEGRFTNSWTGAKRDMKVQMKGKWNGVSLSLKEDFVYSDGEKDQKTWVFTKLNETTYSGTREDVVREAEVKVYNNEIFLTYVAKIGGFDLNFKDRLTLLDDTTVRNTADVLFLNFIKVGEVELTIKRKSR